MSPTDDAATLAALGTSLGLSLTPAQTDALLKFMDLLERWNKTYNLTAVRTRAGMWTQHLADCLAVVAPLLAVLPQGRVLDVGSGGGLPGVVIAICAPSLSVSCVDAVAKKAAFVRQVAGELDLPNLLSLHGRVEVLRTTPFDLVTSRAFASLSDFVRWTQHLLTPRGYWLAMKGKSPDVEWATLPRHVEVFHVEQLKVPRLDAQRCLVWMRRTAPL